MPLLQENDEYGGYGIVLDHTFRGLLSQVDKSLGGLAVVFDKNLMEASGYAAVMADLMKEPIYLVEYHAEDEDPNVKWQDRLLYVRDEKKGWRELHE